MALSADTPLKQVIGTHTDGSVYTAVKVYEGAMLGDINGYVRPLTALDKFMGHSLEYQDNLLGSSGDRHVEHLTGKYRLVCALVGLMTDINQPVYASDDATLTFSAAGNSYVGRISRYESATKMEIEFQTCCLDEFGNNANRVLKSANYSTLLADSGKIIYVDTDAVVITLVAIATGLSGYEITIVNAAGYGVSGLIIDPNGTEVISGGCGLAPGGAGKKFTNTKATAQRGDFLKLTGNATGWNVVNARGTWAIEA